MNFTLYKLGLSKIELNSWFSPDSIVGILSNFQLYNFDKVFKNKLYNYFYAKKFTFSWECIFRGNCDHFRKTYSQGRRECSSCVYLCGRTDYQSISVNRGKLIPAKSILQEEKFFIRLCNDLLFDNGLYGIKNHRYISCARNKEELARKILLIAGELKEKQFRIFTDIPQIDSLLKSNSQDINFIQVKQKKPSYIND